MLKCIVCFIFLKIKTYQSLIFSELSNSLAAWHLVQEEDLGLAAHYQILLWKLPHSWRTALPYLLQTKASVLHNESCFKLQVCIQASVRLLFTAQDCHNISFLSLCFLSFIVKKKVHFKIVQHHQRTEITKITYLPNFYTIIMKNIETKFANISFINLEFQRTQMLLYRWSWQQLFTVRWWVKRNKLFLCFNLIWNFQNKYLSIPFGYTFSKENTQSMAKTMLDTVHWQCTWKWRRMCFSTSSAYYLSLCFALCIYSTYTFYVITPSCKVGTHCCCSHMPAK